MEKHLGKKGETGQRSLYESTNSHFRLEDTEPCAIHLQTQVPPRVQHWLVSLRTEATSPDLYWDPSGPGP